jgi:Zn-dependent protease with chaperone function
MRGSGIDFRQLDFASLPSGFRERFVILFAIGLLFASYFPSTIWHLAFLSMAHPGAPVIMVPGAVMELGASFYSIPLFLAAVLLFYLLHPRAMTRRFGSVQPVDPNSKLGDICEEAAGRAGLHRVRFLVTADIFEQNAVAFGLPGKRCVCLGGGMRVVAGKNAELARALVSHELAHLRHGDVDIGVLSRSIVQAMIAIACVTLFIVILGYWAFLSSPHARQAFTYTWRFWSSGTQSTWQVFVTLFGWVRAYNFPLPFVFGSLAFFIVLTWAGYASVLRSRELYADVQASQWTSIDSMKALFVGGRRLDRGSNWLANVGRVFSFHPSEAERTTYMEAPELLLRPAFGEIFLSGIVGGAFYCYLSTFTTSVRSNANATGWITLQYPQLTTAQDYYAALKQNTLVQAGVAAFLVSWFLWLAIIGSQTLRASAAVALRVQSGWSLFCRVCLVALIFLLGTAVGDRMNPVVLWTAWNQWPVPGGIPSLFWRNLPMVLVILIFALIGSYMTVPAFRVALRLDAQQPMGISLRLALIVGWVFFVWTAATAISLLLVGDQSFRQPAIASLVWSLISIAVVALALLVKRLRGKTGTAKAVYSSEKA